MSKEKRRFVPPKSTSEVVTKASVKKVESRKLSSKRKLMIGAGLLVAGAAGVGGAIALEAQMNKKSDSEIILEAARNLGVKPDLDEQKLWESSYKDTTVYIAPETGDKEYSARIEETLNLMLKSKNPYFSEAAEYLSQKFSSGRMQFYKLADWQGDVSAGVAFGPNASGDFQYELNVDQDFVLNGSDALTLAGVLNHESWHIKRYEDYLSNFPGSNTVEQTNLLNAYESIPGQLAIEEAFAYSKEAEAYEYQAGLMGQVYAQETSGAENRTSKYLQLGSNYQNPEWQQYILSIGGVKAS